MSDPTLPSPTQHPGQAVDDEIRTRLQRWGSGDETFDADIWQAFADVAALLRRAEKERDELRSALENDHFVAVLKRDWHAFQADLAATRAERDRMRPVVEKVGPMIARWRQQGYRPGTGWSTGEGDALVTAWDTYETQDGTE